MTAEPSKTEPQSLEEALAYFSSDENSLRYLASRRWPDGTVRCPTCGTQNVRFLTSRGVWECGNEHPRKQFSVRAGTIFAESHIHLGQWLSTIWMLIDPEAKTSSYKVARRIGVTQKTAWFMLRRIKIALQILGERQPSSAV